MFSTSAVADNVFIILITTFSIFIIGLIPALIRALA